jgi:hypothetical protein
VVKYIRSAERRPGRFIRISAIPDSYYPPRIIVSTHGNHGSLAVFAQDNTTRPFVRSAFSVCSSVKESFSDRQIDLIDVLASFGCPLGSPPTAWASIHHCCTHQLGPQPPARIIREDIYRTRPQCSILELYLGLANASLVVTHFHLAFSCPSSACYCPTRGADSLLFLRAPQWAKSCTWAIWPTA